MKTIIHRTLGAAAALLLLQTGCDTGPCGDSGYGGFGNGECIAPDATLADDTTDASGADGDTLADVTSDIQGDIAADTGPELPSNAVLTGLECPRVDLGNTVPAFYSGSTVGLPNIATSSRLEWTDAPDDAVQFTAPEAGDYTVTLTSANLSMGASASVYTGTSAIQTFFDPSDCPSQGGVVEIDGWFDGDALYPWTLTKGQTILIWVGVPYWAAEATGEYTLTVDML